jgi:two-component system, NtrC family, sensor kinase
MPLVNPIAPRLEGEQAKFRQEVEKASLLGLRLVAAHAILIPPLLWLARFRLIPAPADGVAAMAPSLAIMGLGAMAMGLAQVRGCRRQARAVTALLVWLIAAVLIWFVLFRTEHLATGEHRLPGYLSLLMLLTVLAVPWRPLQALGLGGAIGGWYLLCSAIAGNRDLGELLFVVLAVVALAPVVAAFVYAQRVASFRVREQAMKANEYLCLAQSRVLLSENAASLGRLAATLVHELNSPLGALTSAVDTMMVISAKQATAPQEQQQRLLTLQADVRRSIHASLERLQRTVTRIERLTALDDSEFQSIDVNELLRDVAGLVETQSKNRVTVDFDLRPLPPLTCQPQQLSAVFRNVLTNAARAMGGSGGIRISSGLKNNEVEIRVEDRGCGIDEEKLALIFEPGFRVAGGRISTGNWSLFSCRQIIHGHGGEMYITSVPEKGSTVVITLPL